MPAIVKINSSGNIVGQLPTNSFANPKLEFVPESNLLISLEENGQLLFIDPTTLTVLNALDINEFSADASAVVDVSTGLLSDFSGLIQNSASTYGDFDVRVNGGTIQLLISGLSQAQTLPFVLRLEIENGIFTESKVLISSTADAQSVSPQTPRLGRGIAVNNQGTVLTTLPLPGRLGPQDVKVTFNADIEVSDGIQGEEFLLFDNQVDIYSQGLTTDLTGNFYVTTNSVGSVELGVVGEGALVIVPSDVGNEVFAQGIGLINSSFRDVAINPATGVPFVIVDDLLSGISGGGDLLVAFPEASGQITI